MQLYQKDPKALIWFLWLLVTIILPNVGLAQTDTAEGAEDGIDGQEQAEEAIDLDSLEEEEATAGGGHPGGHPGTKSDDASKPYKFKIFFDFLVEYEWNTDVFQFSSDHAYIMLEMIVADWLRFRTDVAPSPEFFEIVFNFGRYTELRVGKNLIPFGQNEFHSLIGGRVDEQSLFMPIIWADYGLVLKQKIYDGDVIGLESSFWVGNGFQSRQNEFDMPVPTRNAGSITDNNMMKGIGARPELTIGQNVTLGTSWYFDKWSKEDDSYLLYYGVDIDFGYGLIPVTFLRDLRLRGELAWGEVQLPERNYYAGNGFLTYGTRRSGYYGELSYKPLAWLIFKYREGMLNPDSTKEDENDILIHEPSVRFVFGPVMLDVAAQFQQFKHDNDATRAAQNRSYAYTRLFFRY